MKIIFIFSCSGMFHVADFIDALFFAYHATFPKKNGCEGDYGASEDVFFWETTFHKLSIVTKIKTFGRFLTELQILE